MSLLNPWVLLAIFLAIAGAGATGYYKGHTAAQDAARAKYATDLEASIAQHNANAVIDMAAAAEVAARESAARTRIAMLRGRTNEVIRANPSPVSCAWPTDRFGLLLTAVQEASGDSQDTAARLSTAVGKANASSVAK